MCRSVDLGVWKACDSHLTILQDGTGDPGEEGEASDGQARDGQHTRQREGDFTVVTGFHNNGDATGLLVQERRMRT